MKIIFAYLSQLLKDWRANLILFFIFAFGAVIIIQLFLIQIVKHDYYKALARGQQSSFQPAKGDRGEIFFRNGQVLATNIKERYVFVSPTEIKETEKTAETISFLLDLDKEEILEKLKKNGLFEKIKVGLSEKEYNDLKEINLYGVYIRESIFRKYPQEFMAASIVGFLGGLGIGQYGLEGYYDTLLQGEEYVKKSESDERDAKGRNIFLTVDYNIQFMAEKLLRQAKEDLNIKAGQIIVIEPSSGRIMALADFPNFNPNKYKEVDDLEVFQNSAIQKLFEPGSVFKPITMAGALDQGKITPKTNYVDKGEIKIGSWSIHNYNEKVFGLQTMTQVLEKSINTGAVFVERQLGHELFLEYISKFGFFEPTGIDLQGEIFSKNERFKKGYEINFSNASFGQGIEMTPIQLVRAFSAIANEGKLVKPYIVEKISQENQIKEKMPYNQVISQKTASELTTMLVSVIENGFSKAAKIPGYYIAGKTGTAQVSWSALGISKKGYSDETWQSFVGFGPAFDAQFLILIKLDNPETRTAEYSAVPIFKELAKYIIDYLEIPPDYE